jgi:isopentenyl-diphosphate delta-isomerase
MAEEISKRKKEHLQIVHNQEVNYREQTTGFENFHFVHNALPEIDLDEIATQTEFLGYKLAMPLMISSMSGGEKEGEKLNRDLAKAANQHKIPLALGSIRPALENRAALPSYLVARQYAPDIPLIANIGATQLVKDLNSQKLLELLREIQVDALSIHLNSLQEALQPEGQPHFKGVSQAIERLKDTLPLPIIVKEVGFGLSLDVIKHLVKIGVQWVDIAGAGGTSWSRIEHQRTKTKIRQEVATQFFECGIPTTTAIQNAVKLKRLHVIASGGIDNGLKFAKAIALGAELAGAATTFLIIRQKEGLEGLARIIQVYGETLRISMFCTGCKNLAEFRGNPAIINSQ